MGTQTTDRPVTRFAYLKDEMEAMRTIRLGMIEDVIDVDPERDSTLQILDQLLDIARFAEKRFPA